MKTETNRALAAITRFASAANAALDRFSQEFAADPARAFETADRAFRAAAAKKVSTRALALIGRGASVDEVRADLREAVLTGARLRDDRSTSPSSNEMARAVLQAQAELLHETDVA